MKKLIIILGLMVAPAALALDITSGEIKWRHLAERNCELDLSTMDNMRHAESWPECHLLYGFSIGLDLPAMVIRTVIGHMNEVSGHPESLDPQKYPFLNIF